MNSKLLKIAMCLMLVGGIAGMQNGYSMEENDFSKQQPGRQRIGLQKIQENAYLNKIFKDKNIKGSGFSDYKEKYKFDYDINKLVSLAKPSEKTLENTMLAIGTAIKNADFKSANKSLKIAQNAVRTANNSSVQMRGELTYLAGRDGDYVNALNNIDAQQEKISETINYYKQQIETLEIQLNQIQEKSDYIDGQYQILNNTIEQAVSIVDKYHNATVSARTTLMDLAGQVQIMKNEINDIDINDKELKDLNQTISDINTDMQNNVIQLNTGEKDFTRSDVKKKYLNKHSNIINEDQKEENEGDMSLKENRNEINIESASIQNKQFSETQYKNNKESSPSNNRQFNANDEE